MTSRLGSTFEHLAARLARLRRGFDARALRERLLLTGAAVAVVWLLADSLWLSSASRDWAAARQRVTSARMALAEMNTELARRGGQARSDDKALRAEVALLRDRVAEGDVTLRSFGGSLVGPAEMVPILDALLGQVGGLRLKSMQSLPRTEVGAAAPAIVSAAASGATAVEPAATLFRHGVELAVEGSYADVVAYVSAIEAMPQRVLWGSLQLKVEQHPKVVVTLRLYTLSQDRTWLEI